MNRRIVELDLNNFENLYCPVCGRHLIGADADGLFCPHVMFIYAEGIGEFIHTDESIQKDAEAWTNDEDLRDKCFDLDMALQDYMITKMPETAIVISITTCGMACGPVSNTDLIGIDLEGEE